MAYVLYGNCWSGPTYKVALMLSLCGVNFDYRYIDLEARENREPWYVAKARFGQVPCLEDVDDDKRFVQSPVILEYLADKHRRFRGATEEARQEIREWFYWEFDRLAPYIYRPRGCAKGYLKAIPEVLTDLTKIGARGLKVLDKHLAQRTWMVGTEPTISDVDIYGIVSFAREGFFDLTDFPAVSAFMKRIEELPGFQTYHDLIPAHDRRADEMALGRGFDAARASGVPAHLAEGIVRPN